ncbi:MAG: hypothetical protein JWQ46_2547 [Phenylobacterium sp.]|nr:hypothetical protein [Phenylobacterium sp.]
MNRVMRSPFLVNADQTLSKVAVRLLVGGYVALGALNAQAAATADLQPAFGNTVVSTYPDGRTLQVWLHPDGSWDGQSRRGTALAGHWTVKGDKVCFRQSTPPTLPISFCSPFPQHPEVGAQWASKDISGTPIHLTLEKGIIQKPVSSN